MLVISTKHLICCQMYEKNEVLRHSGKECQFESTTPEFSSPQLLLAAAKSGEQPNFQAFW